MTAEADTDTDTTAKMKSLEQRYIALLEEKIALLEKQLADAATKPAAPKEATKEQQKETENDNQEKQKNQGKEKEKEEGRPEQKSPRTRRIARQYNINGILEDVPEEDQPDLTKPKKFGPEQNFAITWCVIYEFNDNGSLGSRKLSSPQLMIDSPGLRKALTDVIAGDYPTLSFDTREVIILYPYACIYHSKAKLEEYAKTAPENVKEDIDILISEVFAALEKEATDAKKLGERKVITFDLLWTLFHPGGLIYASPIMNQPQVFLVNYVDTIDPDQPKESRVLRIWAYSMDYSGKEFNRLDIPFKLKYFEGSKPISGLQAYPLECYEDPDDKTATVEKLKKRLLARGKRFEELCTATKGRQMFEYQGQIIDEGQDYLLSQTPEPDENAASVGRANGKIPSLSPYASKEELPFGSQVMVDFQAFFQSVAKAVSVGSLEGTWSTDCTCASCTGWARTYDGFSPTSSKPHKRRLTELQLLLCPPRVLGFALWQKTWVQLLVDNVAPLKTEGTDTAFKLLELAPKTKELIKSLVQQHTKNNGKVSDLIPGKGNGLIVLLHGPPGVGKTLTAESVAMLTGKPLYSISMSDIGLSSAVAETNLIRIFDLAEVTCLRKAILLFDEADVFLESRSLSNLQRNGLVSMLLRVLEYYQGILFLTTNRVKTFDEAFQSRVHIAIKYEELTPPQRRKIWLMWLHQLSPKLANESDQEISDEIDDLSNEPFNGRQIRNIIASAQAMATSKSKYAETTFADITRVVKVTKEFQVYLNHSSELAKMQMLR